MSSSFDLTDKVALVTGASSGIGAATAVAARKIRDKAAHLAAHLLECSVDDLVWQDHQFQVKGAPERSKTMADLAQ